MTMVHVHQDHVRRGTVLVSTARSDLGTGAALAKSLAMHWPAIGAAILRGQAIGGNMRMYSGTPRVNYALRAAVALPIEKRWPFGGFISPPSSL